MSANVTLYDFIAALVLLCCCRLLCLATILRGSALLCRLLLMASPLHCSLLHSEFVHNSFHAAQLYCSVTASADSVLVYDSQTRQKEMAISLYCSVIRRRTLLRAVSQALRAEGHCSDSTAPGPNA